MNTKGSRTNCYKCNVFTAPVVKGEIIDIGEYYLNYLTGAVKINIFCKKCSNLLRFKIFKFKSKINHKCKQLKYDKNLEIIEERNGFKLLQKELNTGINIVRNRKNPVYKNPKIKRDTTWKYITLKLNIDLKCEDCKEILEYSYNKEYRIFTFDYQRRNNENIKTGK